MFLGKVEAYFLSLVVSKSVNLSVSEVYSLQYNLYFWTKGDLPFYAPVTSLALLASLQPHMTIEIAAEGSFTFSFSEVELGCGCYFLLACNILVD